MISRERIVFYTKILGLQVILKNDLSVSFWYKIDVPIFKKQKPVYHFAFDIPKKSTFGGICVDDNGTEILEVIPPDKIADFL
jgi:catechol-2,3-dioxygenase